MPWQDGDYLTPTNLNTKGLSATSAQGFSTNTLRTESGNTLSLLAPSSALVAKSVDSGGWGINVLATGAVPSLAVDSTTAIQRALNTAAAAGGGYVQLPPGQYAISSLTLGRNVTLAGAAGGRDLNGASPTQLYQASASTTVVFLTDTSGSGAVLQDLAISAFGNANNQGGVLVQHMGACHLFRVAVYGMRDFGVRIRGGDNTNYNLLQNCVIAVQSTGTCIDIVCDSAPGQGMDSPSVVGCYINSDLPWLSARSESSSPLPDCVMLTGNRFISGSNITALDLATTNSIVMGNRFETTGGGATMQVRLTQAGSQAAARFVGNDYAAPAGVVFSDSTAVPSQRILEHDTFGIDQNLFQSGTTIAPALGFASEHSLGLYRSAASTMALSYGTFHLNQARLTSIRTMATSLASTSMLTDEMAFFVGGASGATLGLRVNGIVYLFNSSSTTKG